MNEIKISVHRVRIQKRTWASTVVSRLAGDRHLVVFRPTGFDSATCSTADRYMGKVEGKQSRGEAEGSLEEPVLET